MFYFSLFYRFISILKINKKKEIKLLLQASHSFFTHIYNLSGKNT